MLFNKIWKLLSSYQKKIFFVLVVFNIFILIMEVASLSAVFPIIHSLTSDQNFFDQVDGFDYFKNFISGSNYHPAVIFLFILTLIIIVKNILLTIYNYLECKFIFETQENISVDLFSNLMSREYNYHLNVNSADLITRIRTDGVLIRDSINALHVFFKSVVFLIGIFSFLIYVEPFGFFITGGIFFILGSLFYKFTSKKITEFGKIRQTMEINRTQKLQESFGGIKEIKTFLKKDIFLSSYRKLTQTIAKSYYWRDFTVKLPTVFLETLIIIIITILTFISLMSQKDSVEIIVILGVFSLTAIKALPHMSSLLSAINTFKFSKLPITFYSDLLSVDRKFKDKINHSEKLDFNNEIYLKNIWYKYPNKENYIFENASIEIKKGDKVLIKGKTGVGKSTLVDLILGFQKPNSGEIFVDKKIYNLHETKWLQNISYVPQSIYMFDASIKYNITLNENDEEFDQTLFNQALKVADLENFVNSLPSKENTFVGETGLNISGGQKQRIGIARALYKNSNIIILDESTNALDVQTELKVINNLKNKKDKTIILISHKSDIIQFDKIYNLENKKVLPIN